MGLPMGTGYRFFKGVPFPWTSPIVQVSCCSDPGLARSSPAALGTSAGRAQLGPPQRCGRGTGAGEPGEVLKPETHGNSEDIVEHFFGCLENDLLIRSNLKNDDSAC
jgi:hypothetical protein